MSLVTGLLTHTCNVIRQTEVKDNGGGFEYGTYQKVNPWLNLNPIPVGRVAAAAQEVGGVIYLIGGEAIGQIRNKNEAYTIATDSWSTKANLPYSATFIASGVISNQIYVAGGTLIHSNFKYCYRYNPATNTWTQRLDMNSTHQGGAGAVYNGKLYVFGGSNGATYGEVYDPVANTWTYLAAPPQVLQKQRAVTVGSKIYLVGEGRTQIYDPGSDTWTQGASMNLAARNLFAAVEAGGKVWAIGGADAVSAPVRTVETYDPATDTWTYGIPMTETRDSFPGVTVSGVIYILGGVNPSDPLTIVQKTDATNSTAIRTLKTTKQVMVSTPTGGRQFVQKTTVYFEWAMEPFIKENDILTNFTGPDGAVEQSFVNDVFKNSAFRVDQCNDPNTLHDHLEVEVTQLRGREIPGR